MAQKKKGKRSSGPRGNAVWKGSRRRTSPAMLALILAIGVVAAAAGYLMERSSLLRADAEAPASGLQLDEIMSENSTTLITETGDVPDWIEVRNAGSEDVSLKGYSLLLGSRFNKIFNFPEGTLKPGECAVIYADGTKKGGWSAPFRLPASGGETLVLLSPQDKAVDSVDLPELGMDESYARTSSGEWEITEAATPGADNGSAPVTAAERGIEIRPDAVELSEIVTNNTLYFADENGEHHDYVEIHNTTGSAVALGGWYLSDTSSDLKRWTFPDVTLPADGYLAVHCSGYNRTGDAAHLHTNFKLGKGESVYLSRPDGRTVSAATPEVLASNQAWSLYEGQWSAQLAPTPGMENSAAAAAKQQAELFGSALNGVYINEIMASPSEQDYDWIELCNGSGQAVDLSNYGLSDDSSRPRRWQFPAGTAIQPGEYMVVFLTGDASITSDKYICADFALGSSGGYTVCLSDPDGKILDAAYLGEQYGGIAYGRFAGEDGFYYAASATPAAANSGAHYLGRAGMAEASVRGGLYKTGDSFTVELSAPEGSRIYYTTDCTDPTESSNLYTGPIQVSGTTILRSRVYKDDSMPSLIAAQSYLYDVEVPEGVYVVSLVSDPDGLYSDGRGILVKGPNAWEKFPYGEINKGANFWMDWERESNVELFTSGGELGFAQPCGIKLHGQYSRAEDVKAFKVFARSEYGKNRFDYPIFSQRDYDSYQSFLLRCSGQDFDKTFMRDSVLTALAKDTSLMYQESELGVCYLNGEYYSMFNLRERVSRFSICQFEGWKGMEGDLDLIKANEIEKEGSNASMEELLKWIKSNDTSTQEAYDYIGERIDIQNYIEYMAFEIFSGNGDTLNVKRYRNAKVDGKWRWVLYDLDWAFTVDTNSIRRWLDPEGMGTNKYTDTTLFIGCMKNPTFRDQFLTYMGEQLATTFSTENVLARITERYEKLEPLLPQYLEKIGSTMEKYKKEVGTMGSYAKSRPAKMIGYFKETFNFSDAEMEKYFGAAIQKIRESEGGNS